MKVGLFDSQWRGHHSVYASLIAKSLLEAGHNVTFFTSSNHARMGVFPDHRNFDVFRLHPLNVNNRGGGYLGTLKDQWTRFRQFRRGMDIAQQRDIDIVHFLAIDWFRLPVRAATYISSGIVPIVATLHRDYWATPDQQLTDNVTRQIKRVMKRSLDQGNRKALESSINDRSIDKLLVHAPAIQNRIQSSMNIPPNVVSAISAPTPEPKEDLSTEVAKRQLDLPTDDPVILFFGALGYEKGPDILGKALRSIETSATVVFAGSESEFRANDVARWKKEAPKHAQVVERIEYVPEKKVYTYFAAADFLVLPYRRRYGISGPLRRACMVKTPVIGSDETDIGSIIDDNGLGTTFEYGNPEALAEAIDAVIRNDIPVSIKRIEEYSERIRPERVGRELEETYRKLV